MVYLNKGDWPCHAVSSVVVGGVQLSTISLGLLPNTTSLEDVRMCISQRTYHRFTCRTYHRAALRLALEHRQRFRVGCSGCLGVLVSLTTSATVRASGLPILKSRYVCSWQTLVTNDAKKSSHSQKPPPRKKDGKGRGPSGSRVTGMSSLQDNSNAGTLEIQVLLSHDNHAQYGGLILPIL